MRISYYSYVKIAALLLTSMAIAVVVSGFFFGFLSTLGGANPELSRVIFNPSVTMIYLILYYLLNALFMPSSKAQLFLLVFTLLLSFKVGFVQGSVFLIVFYFLLKKFRII